MQEIKFRAEYKNKIYNVESIYFEDEMISLFDKTIYGEVIKVKISEVNLMQYIGLKDKNGKEIYEGDIVETKTSIISIEWTGHGFNGVYYNSDGTWDDEYEYDIFRSQLEVIGNVYENKNLLNNE